MVRRWDESVRPPRAGVATSPFVFERDATEGLAVCRFLGDTEGSRTALLAFILLATEGTSRFVMPLWWRDANIARLGADFDLVSWWYPTEAETIAWPRRSRGFAKIRYPDPPKDRLALWAAPDTYTLAHATRGRNDTTYEFNIWCLDTPQRRDALVELLQGRMRPDLGRFLRPGEYFVAVTRGIDIGYLDSIEVFCVPECAPRVMQAAAWIDARLGQCEALDEDTDDELGAATFERLARTLPDDPPPMDEWRKILRPRKVVGGFLEAQVAIERFQDEHRFLSNFWPAEIEFEGRRYATVEHAYQAAKTEVDSARAATAALDSPGAAKRAGGHLEVRDDWTAARKVDVMRRLVRSKFLNHADLSQRLLETGHAVLIEGNDWGDQFWGVADGTGENLLGRILMEVRYELENR